MLAEVLSKGFKCADCGSVVAYVSRRRTFAERFVLPALFMRPLRCGECYRRSYRPVYVPARVLKSSEQDKRAA